MFMEPNKNHMGDKFLGWVKEHKVLSGVFGFFMLVLTLNTVSFIIPDSEPEPPVWPLPPVEPPYPPGPPVIPPGPPTPPVGPPGAPEPYPMPQPID
jgi:hypothetical protein